ncbi:hypothetical protein [Pseudomonas sp. CFBP 13719]|uniref:hypothetical protein n=1 Tax=Pseudomonas sp. CFBP 13719 TaxID=2775303 RepID=UPI00178391CD|nr:hypothetical protein [Pseudomonas sp. CFBP 13719]MBD8614994.1 hypothetical protein [Pseudomonas putida]MBD8681323.1 hypothetical protein [Pseudomonas sp. CFBP 13719]
MKKTTALALVLALVCPCIATASPPSTETEECGLGSWQEWAPGNPEYRTPRTLRSVHSTALGVLFDEDHSELIYNSLQAGDFLYTKKFVVSSNASTISYDLCRTHSPGGASDTFDPPSPKWLESQIEAGDLPPSEGKTKVSKAGGFDCKKNGWGEATPSPFDFPEGAVVLIRFGKARVYEDDGVNHRSFDSYEFQGHTYTKDVRHKKDTGYSMDYGVCKSR